MDGNAPLFHEGKSRLHAVCQFSGGGGVGQQRGTHDHQTDSGCHTDGKLNTFPGNGENPEPEQFLTGSQGHPEEEGKAQQQNDGPQTAEHIAQRNIGHTVNHQHCGSDGDIPDGILHQKQQCHIQNGGTELGTGIQSVDGGIYTVILTDGNITKHLQYLPPLQDSGSSVLPALR